MTAGEATLGGIVLAGGQGRRLGGGGKATIELAGEPLVIRAVASLHAAGCHAVVVAARPGVPVPDVEVPVVFDGAGPSGPLNALRTALAHLATDDVVVLACDLPFAGAAVARLARWPAGSVVVTVDDDGREQPLCARYPRGAALSAAERSLAAGEHRLVDWARRVAGGPPVQERTTGRELLNVNTAEDLARARTA